jgi:hypothetical protein
MREFFDCMEQKSARNFFSSYQIFMTSAKGIGAAVLAVATVAPFLRHLLAAKFAPWSNNEGGLTWTLP